jgi:hypothetical protein
LTVVPAAETGGVAGAGVAAWPVAVNGAAVATATQPQYLASRSFKGNSGL